MHSVSVFSVNLVERDQNLSIAIKCGTRAMSRAAVEPSRLFQTSLRWIRRTGKKSISLIAVPPSFLFVNYVLVVCPSFSFFPYSYLSITYIAQNREYPHITSQTSSRDDKQAKNRRSFRVQSREIDFGGIERAGKGA